MHAFLLFRRNHKLNIDFYAYHGRNQTLPARVMGLLIGKQYK